MTLVISTLDDLIPHVGRELGVGDWMLVDQARIQAYADVADDQQWIHVDVERARGSVFGATIAHGYLTLSLIPSLSQSVYRYDGPSMVVNYGIDKVRFPAALLSGSRIRATVTLDAVESGPQGHQVVTTTVVEADTAAKPVCVATSRVLAVF